ncbi:protein MRG2 isoform X1 [Lactuca sativa]|uniref:protein MRG2 isoform X1 n=1 Tax=Lactuca sativa TaxID=4236 RepID=UPI000CD871A4|nr:protein MRG2 isoform X1 [Lactuca sativa]
MRSSNSGSATDDDESATISDEYDATMETDTDVVSKDGAVESLSTPFRQGEKVLAYHNLRIYEAKVLEVDSKEKRYYIHYLGWKQKWDEWVGIDRLMNINNENLQKQKALENELKPKNPNMTKGMKRKTMSKGTVSYEKLIDIHIPSSLKKHLVNYSEYITHMGKLVKLPCSPNVDDILKLYLEHRSNKDGRESDTAGEVVSGLRCYFDKALPAMLLYKTESQQYQQATANQISPSKIYGAEHLLRLFVKLPEILFHANIEEETLRELQHNLQDFLKFLQKKQSLFFLSSYETPDGSCTIE